MFPLKPFIFETIFRRTRAGPTSILPQLLAIIFLFPVVLIQGCFLCPLHVPGRPRPLNQFRLPSIQKLLSTSESINKLCGNNSITTSLREACASDVKKLSCSINALWDTFRSEECPGPENAEQCRKCRVESNHIYNTNSWVLTWIDSIGKMPSGISDGNYHWLGDYEQCLYLANNRLFNGQYCLLQFKVPDTVLDIECEHSQPLEVHLGICLPASCSTQETKELAEYVADHKIDVQCEPPILWPLFSKIFLFASLLWILIVVFVSVMVWLLDEKHSEFVRNKWITSFSLQRNIHDCLRTRSFNGNYHAIQGIQVLSAVLLIFGNLLFQIMPYLENVGFFYGLIENFFIQPIVNYSFYIDGLFALSTFSLAHKLLKDNTRPISTNTIVKIFIRNWPAYAYITIFMSFLYIRLGEGPMWSHSDLSDRCGRSWPFNLLLISNLFGYKKTCLDAGFIFALEGQFLFIILLAIWSIRHCKLISIVSIYCGIFSSIIFIGIISIIYKLPTTLIPTEIGNNISYPVFSNLFYLNPLARASPFLIGLVIQLHFPDAGALVKSAQFKPFSSLLSIFSFVILCWVIWTPYMLKFCDENILASILSFFYSSTHRAIWAVVLIYQAIILDKSKNGLNKFLSWKVFRPLSKLIYIAVLVSEPVSISLFSSLHRPIYATPLSTMMTCVGTVCCSFIIAFLVDVTFSRPIRKLFNNSISLKTNK